MKELQKLRDAVTGLGFKHHIYQTPYSDTYIKQIDLKNGDIMEVRVIITYKLNEQSQPHA